MNSESPDSLEAAAAPADAPPLTAHGVKGLEFRHVIVMDRADWPWHGEDESQLLNVAMTRARETLCVMLAEGGRNVVLLAMAGDEGSELMMRIWAAHASEVLPLVEIARRRIVQQLRPLISRLIEVDGETVQDLSDLEIGQLCYLAHKRGLGANKRDELEGWRSVRNDWRTCNRWRRRTSTA